MVGLRKITKTSRRLRDNLDEFTLNSGKKVYVLGEGRLVNLSAAEGHPSQVMQMSFAGQFLAALHVVEHKDQLKGHEGVVIEIPKEIDREIAMLMLDSKGIKIDTLTPEQHAYLTGWKEGTE